MCKCPWYFLFAQVASAVFAPDSPMLDAEINLADRCAYLSSNDLDLRGMVIISDVSMFGTMNGEILRIYVAPKRRRMTHEKRTDTRV